jgi:hypothetical protein
LLDRIKREAKAPSKLPLAQPQLVTKRANLLRQGGGYTGSAFANSSSVHALPSSDACASISSALHAECDTLWSEDMQDGIVLDGRLRIVNPFRAP